MSVFKDKFVAFIDILGFKKLISGAENGTGISLSEILELLKQLGTKVDREGYDKHGPRICPLAPRIEKNLDFRVTQISDCVIVSAELSPAGVINLVSHCWKVIINLLSQGIMCRGYIVRGPVYHTDDQILGSGYQDAYQAESKVSAFKHKADEKGTPYVEIDPVVVEYIQTHGDACVKEMFSRMVKFDGKTAVLFPFQSLTHSFVIAGLGQTFSPERERESNQKLRATIEKMKDLVSRFTDEENEKAFDKARHYMAALDEQLKACDRTDDLIHKLGLPLNLPTFKRDLNGLI